jgi:hypothetical protein
MLAKSPNILFSAALLADSWYCETGPLVCNLVLHKSVTCQSGSATLPPWDQAAKPSSGVARLEASMLLYSHWKYGRWQSLLHNALISGTDTRTWLGVYVLKLLKHKPTKWDDPWWPLFPSFSVDLIECPAFGWPGFGTTQAVCRDHTFTNPQVHPDTAYSFPVWTTV